MNALMTWEEATKKAPALLTKEKAGFVSDKYQFLDTREMVDIIEANGWQLSDAKQQRANASGIDRIPYKKHLLRFRNEGLIQDKENIPEIVLVNSHDGSFRFQFFAGVYRLVCSNGLVIAKAQIQSTSFKHIGINKDEICNYLDVMAKQSFEVFGKIEVMRSIHLQREDKLILAKQAVELKWEGNKLIPAEDLIQPRRTADNDDSLWTTFNVIQENVMKGGMFYQNEQGRGRHTQAVRNIAEEIRFNTGLWELVEKHMSNN